MGFWRGVLNVVGSIPVVGHVTAGVQYIAGDKEGAQKSLAASTGNLASTIGAVGGFMVGGPPGAVAGGAAGAALGGQIENKINGKDLDLSPGKLVGDALIGGASGLIGGGGAGNALKGAGAMIGKEFGKTTLKITTGSILKTGLASTTGQCIRAAGDEISSPGPSPRHNDDDPEVPDEKIRVVTRNQEAKSRQVEDCALGLNTECANLQAQGIPTNCMNWVQDVAGNVANALSLVVRHPLPWATANMGVQEAKRIYFDRKQTGKFLENQQRGDETGHGYDFWPKIDAGLSAIERLLGELEVAMQEELYMAAQRPR